MNFFKQYTHRLIIGVAFVMLLVAWIQKPGEKQPSSQIPVTYYKLYSPETG